MTMVKSFILTIIGLLLTLSNSMALAMEPILVTPETRKEFKLNYRVDFPQYDPDLAVMRFILERKGGFSEVTRANFEKRSVERPQNLEASVPIDVKLEKGTLVIQFCIDPRIDTSGWYLCIPETDQPKTLGIVRYLIPLKPHIPAPPDEDPKGP